MADETLAVRGVSHDYGSVRALDGVSFAAREGEIVALLGPNGAGKTTTLRIITGFFFPTEGEARIAGFPAASREARTRLGYLPESTPLDLLMSVEEYLRFWTSARGVAPGRIREVVDLLQLGERAGESIATLSKGFRQRVGLAAAILHDPDLLVLDEPTSALDPNQVREAREMIRALGRRKTVLLSTHILSEVEEIADRVVVLSRGKVVADGPVAEVLSRGSLRLALRPFDAANLARLGEILRAAGLAVEREEECLLFAPAPGAEESEAKLFRLAADAGIPVEITRRTFSLDEVFADLTTDSDEGEDSDA